MNLKCWSKKEKKGKTERGDKKRKRHAFIWLSCNSTSMLNFYNFLLKNLEIFFQVWKLNELLEVKEIKIML